MNLSNALILKSLLIVIIVIIYWKLVYYKFHTKPITPISFFAVGGSLFFYGFYLYYFKQIVSFTNIEFLFYVGALFLIVSFMLVLIAIRKHGLNPKIDITLTWVSTILGTKSVYFFMLIAFPAFFFIMLATYKLLGEEHVIFWGMIFLAWVASNIRLYRRQIAR